MKIIITIIGIAFFALVITWNSIPHIIKWAHKSGKLTGANHRSSHKSPTPSLGGVGILLGMLVVLPFLELPLPIAATCISVIILFATGLLDDLYTINVKFKLIFQIISALLIYFSGLQIESLHGVFGIFEIPQIWSFVITVLFIVGVINAFNLLDGINGLAGSLTVINSAVFGLIFYFNGQTDFALIAFALFGGVLGFLRYNMLNAKIFLGDSGSLFIGLFMSVFVIQTLQTNTYSELSVSLALSLICIPIFDMLRLITTRIMEHKSPVMADKNHLHHLVVKATKNHIQATILIITLHLVLLGTVILESYYAEELLLHSVILILLSGLVSFLGLFVFMEIYGNIKRLRNHIKLLTGNNRLLEKL